MKTSKNLLLPLLLLMLFTANQSQAQTSNNPPVQAAMLMGNWTCLGPEIILNQGTDYGLNGSITKVDISPLNEQIIVAGTESGEVYRSTDGGSSWNNISLSLYKNASLSLIKMHPEEEEEIYIGYGSYLLYSDDAGQNWDIIFQFDNLKPRELFIDSDNHSMLLVAAKGSFYSDDQGQTWTHNSSEEVYDLLNLDQSEGKLFMLSKDNADSSPKLSFSTDQGQSFTKVEQDWDNTSFDEYLGGKLASSAANSNQLYIYLIGNQNTANKGFLGLWLYDIATDELEKTYNTGPYSVLHPNPSTMEYNSSTHRGFDYCHLIANPQDPNQLLIGSLNLFTSSDMGQHLEANNFISQDGPEFYKLRVRDMTTEGNLSLIATDGGLYKSYDFFQSNNYEFISSGIHNAYCFDFAQGWNEDVIITSLKHNGNNARLETYPEGTFVYLGGSENTFLGINPYNSRQSFFSELNEVFIPDQTTNAAVINENNFTIEPEGSKQAVESTELRFDPHCFNIAYTGVGNKLMVSNNGGRTFATMHSFDPSYRITEIEISRHDPDHMFLNLQHNSVVSKSCRLFKSTNRGSSWTEVPLPNQGQDKHLLLELDASEKDRLFIAFKHPYSGNRIYESTNGGSNWTPISAAGIPSSEFIHALSFANGYEKGLYLFTNRTAYVHDPVSGWSAFNQGLPLEINSSAADIFYRDGKLRFSSYGKGLWEYSFDSPQLAPVATISVDRFEKNKLCDSGTVFYFMDYSMAEKDAFTRVWSFGDGEIIDDNLWNKRSVLFTTTGEKTAKLQLLDSAGSIVAEDSITIKINLTDIPNSIDVDFEDNSLGTGLHVQNSSGDITWQLINGYGAYGESNSSFWLNNYNNMNMGSEEVITFRVDLSDYETPYLVFDLAYALFPCLEDQLNIFGSSCQNLSGELLRSMGGEEMKSTERQEGTFFPYPSEWKTVKIPLENFGGIDRTFLQIKSVNEYGNNIFIDNIRISED